MNFICEGPLGVWPGPIYFSISGYDARVFMAAEAVAGRIAARRRRVILAITFIVYEWW